MSRTSKPVSSLATTPHQELERDQLAWSKQDLCENDTYDSSDDEYESNYETEVRKLQWKRALEGHEEPSVLNKKQRISKKRPVDDIFGEGVRLHPQSKKKKQTITKEEKALLVLEDMAARGGLKRELPFGGKGENDMMLGVRGVGDSDRVSVGDGNVRQCQSSESKAPVAKSEGDSSSPNRPKLAKSAHGTVGTNSSMAKSAQTANATSATAEVKTAVVADGGGAPPDLSKGITGTLSRPDPARHFGYGDFAEKLAQPRFASGSLVTGSKSDKRRWRKQNKQTRRQLQLEQQPTSYWTQHTGAFTDQLDRKPPADYRGGM